VDGPPKKLIRKEKKKKDKKREKSWKGLPSWGVLAKLGHKRVLEGEAEIMRIFKRLNFGELHGDGVKGEKGRGSPALWGLVDMIPAERPSSEKKTKKKKRRVYGEEIGRIWENQAPHPRKP